MELLPSNPSRANTKRKASATSRSLERIDVLHPTVPQPIQHLVEYVPAWLADHPSYFRRLAEEIQFERSKIFVYGHECDEPRGVAWYSKDPKRVSSYVYSGKLNRAKALTPVLCELFALVEKHTGITFDSVLCNLYEKGADSVSWHADDEPELDSTSIASVSLGGARDFYLREKKNHKQQYRFTLSGGDLLLMKSTCQDEYEHSVPKRARAQTRINLTFRRMASN